MERGNDGEKLIFLPSSPLTPHICVHRLDAPFWQWQSAFSMQMWWLLSSLRYQSCSFGWIFCSCKYSVLPFITASSLSCSHLCNTTLKLHSTPAPDKGPQLLMPPFPSSLHSTPWKGCACLLYPLNLISSQSLLWALVPATPGSLLLVGYCDVRVHCWGQSSGPPLVHSAVFGITNLL